MYDNIVIFCIVLFIYLHVQFHLKTSNDLELYEINQPTKDAFEHACNARQPIVVNGTNIPSLMNINRTWITSQAKFNNTELNVRNGMEMGVPLKLKDAVELFHKDTTNKYYSDNNHQWIRETGISKMISLSDGFFKPPFLLQCMYDLMCGSENATTPCKHEVNHRNFFIVTQGQVRVKLMPPNTFASNHATQYDTFEFTHPENVWNNADLKCIDAVVKSGQILFIPAYWWYSFQFTNDASVVSLKYRTIMNTIAVSPLLFMHVLQLQNIKRKTMQLWSPVDVDAKN